MIDHRHRKRHTGLLLCWNQQPSRIPHAVRIKINEDFTKKVNNSLCRFPLCTCRLFRCCTMFHLQWCQKHESSCRRYLSSKVCMGRECQDTEATWNVFPLWVCCFFLSIAVLDRLGPFQGMGQYCMFCIVLFPLCKMIHRELVLDDHILSFALRHQRHMNENKVPSLTNFPSRHQLVMEGLRCWRTFDLDTTRKGNLFYTIFLKDCNLTLWCPQLVPGAAGRNNVVQVPLSAHHSCEHISSSCEHTVVSSVALNCSLHWRSALYMAPAGSSGYWYSSKSVGASSRHFPRPWLSYENKKVVYTSLQTYVVDLLQKVCDVASTTIGPWNRNCIRFEARRHDMQNRPTSMIASCFSRVMVHAKAFWKEKHWDKWNCPNALRFRIINNCITFCVLRFFVFCINQYP